VRQTYRGRTLWTFPGGAIEPGETREQAAVREAREATGYRCVLGGPGTATPTDGGPRTPRRDDGGRAAFAEPYSTPSCR
jgi:8-oxo-dGTP pyrophosphatase MutT (NUDIX family)